MLRIGDKVETIDDALKGIVKRIKGDTVHVMVDQGFELVFTQRELVKIASEDIIAVNRQELQQVIAEKELPKRRKISTVKPKDRNQPKMEVDLHIHHLVPSSKGMSNYDMLSLQLETAKRQLEFAIKNRIQKVVFIHGVGEGVLKTELEYLFGRFDQVSFYDADYQKYGLGATEVYIYQNAK
ncbi:DNA mismatch repair protein MutS [Imtechella halotolerans]|nr:Smr/MutS family protein [Imtechella halotolerans]WMQ62209.1 DNA mismatch repair protein MutS [Imtechella halotolerans]